jgi:hypothetical protein
MGHLHIIKIFQRHGIPLDVLEGEKYNILEYAKLGLDEFKDNYEFHLRGEFSSEAVNEHSVLSEELAQKKLSDIDSSIYCLMSKQGHPEVRLSQYHALIDYLVPLFEMDQSLTAVTSALGSMHMSQSAFTPAQNELDHMLAVENRYFDFSRSTSTQTSQLKTTFVNNRYGTFKRTVPIENIPTRRLITADSTSVRESIRKSGGEQNLTSEQEILAHLKWPHTVNSYGTNYPW